MSRSVRGVDLKILRVTAHFSVITQKVVNEFLLNYGNGHERLQKMKTLQTIAVRSIVCSSPEWTTFFSFAPYMQQPHYTILECALACTKSVLFTHTYTYTIYLYGLHVPILN